MNALQTWFLSYLVNSLWQVPLLFAAGWLAARVLRSIGAVAEHRLWVSVLLLQTLLPAASTLPSQILRSLAARIGALVAFLTNAPRPAASQVFVIMGSGTALTTLHIPPALLSAIAIAYAAVVLYFAARFFWRCHHLRTLRRESTPIALTGVAATYWTQCLQHFALGKVTIAASPRVRGPVTIGLADKLLLLPEAMVPGLDEADLRTVIAHEFAHMRRSDFLKNLIYELITLPVSYHPALWLTRDRITETREIICDQVAAPVASSVPDSIESRNEYARSLLRLASSLVTGMPARTPHAIGVFDANAFERRLMHLTQQPLPLRASRRFALIAACAALGLTTCASALTLRLSVNAPPVADEKAAAHSPDSLTVPASEMAGNVLNKITPKYPEEAKKERIQGTILLSAVIGKDGAIENLTVISGPKELQQSALDAVRQWTYKPYRLNGSPVEVETKINVVYSLAR